MTEGIDDKVVVITGVLLVLGARRLSRLQALADELRMINRPCVRDPVQGRDVRC